MISDIDATRIGNTMLGRGLGRAALIIVTESIDQKTTAQLVKQIAAYAKWHSPQAAEGFTSLFEGPLIDPWLKDITR